MAGDDKNIEPVVHLNVPLRVPSGCPRRIDIPEDTIANQISRTT
jgi:hypothetical protein